MRITRRRLQRPPAPGLQAEVSGTRLHWVRQGDTPPRFLLLHGYLAHHGAWRHHLPVLGEHGAVAVDLPGHGYSEMSEAIPASPAGMARLVPALLDRLEAERAVLVGHSLGGAVALFAAAQAPERVAGLVLVSPFVYPQPAPPGLRTAARFPSLFRRLFSSPPGRAGVGMLLERASSVPPGEDPRERAMTLLSHLDAPGGWRAAQRTGVAALTEIPDRALVASLRAPALVFWGLADAVRPVRMGERLCREYGGPCELERLEGAGHNLHEEHPALFSERVLSWCRDQALLG
jgi:pimeloyl-ACP methyl ester carboxylesterase